MGIGIKTRRSSISSIFIPIEADGGNVTDVEIDGEKYRIHAFTDVGEDEFEVSSLGTTDGKIDVLVVGGGGGGGGANDRLGGGGGAGGLVYVPSYKIPSGSHSITVGDGGDGGPGGKDRGSYDGFGELGEDSIFQDLIAKGGGRGSPARTHDYDESWMDGGSAGGSSHSSSLPDGVGSALQLIQSDESGEYGYGNIGGGSDDTEGGAGGGGAGERGEHMAEGPSSHLAGRGGIGRDYSKEFTTNFGDNGWFASGGSGGTRETSSSLEALFGGGGEGGGSNENGHNAIPNTGGGGGGAGGDSSSPDGGNGGSGIVLIRYPLEKMYKTVEEYALEFDGSSDYVSLGNDIEFISNNNEWSFFTWVKLNDLSELRHITGVTSEHDNGWTTFAHFGFDDNKITWWDTDDGWRYGKTSLNTNQFYFIGLTYDGNGTTTFWLNGNKDGTSSVVGNQDMVRIGEFGRRGHTSPPDRYFKGLIKNISIWNYELSEEEVKNHMNVSPKGNEEGLVTYYDFQDSQGDTLTDKAGNNDGTIHGAEWVKTGNMIKKDY